MFVICRFSFLFEVVGFWHFAALLALRARYLLAFASFAAVISSLLALRAASWRSRSGPWSERVGPLAPPESTSNEGRGEGVNRSVSLASVSGPWALDISDAFSSLDGDGMALSVGVDAVGALHVAVAAGGGRLR